jgi:hypothetical protein
MSSKVKGYGLLTLGILLTYLAVVSMLGAWDFVPDFVLSGRMRHVLEERVFTVSLAGLALLFVAQWVWRMGRRTLDPNWVPPRSFRLRSRTSAPPTPRRPD